MDEALIKLFPLETLAVSLFESFVRQRNDMEIIQKAPCWSSLEKEDRIFWRNKAVEMTTELYELKDEEWSA
jgi:hypothetical protein